MDLCRFLSRSKRTSLTANSKFCEHLRSNTYINQKHPRVALDAAIYLARRIKGSPSGFEFHSYFDVWHAPVHRRRTGGAVGRPSNPNVRLTASVLISLDHGAFTNVSYCLSVCRMTVNKSKPTTQVSYRKFHFDITVATDQAQRQASAAPAKPSSVLRRNGTVYDHDWLQGEPTETNAPVVIRTTNSLLADVAGSACRYGFARVPRPKFRQIQGRWTLAGPSSESRTPCPPPVLRKMHSGN